jgi:hypothetical protein
LLPLPKAAGATIKLVDYVRFQLGEGIEKEETDFAAEVAAAAGLSKFLFRQGNQEGSPETAGLFVCLWVSTILCALVLRAPWHRQRHGIGRLRSIRIDRNHDQPIQARFVETFGRSVDGEPAFASIPNLWPKWPPKVAAKESGLEICLVIGGAISSAVWRRARAWTGAGRLYGHAGHGDERAGDAECARTTGRADARSSASKWTRCANPSSAAAPSVT